MRDDYKVTRGWGRVRGLRVVKAIVTHSSEEDSRSDILEDIFGKIRLLWGLDLKDARMAALVRLYESLRLRVSMETELLSLRSRLSGPAVEFLPKRDQKEIELQIEALKKRLENPFGDPEEQ